MQEQPNDLELMGYGQHMMGRAGKEGSPSKMKAMNNEHNQQIIAEDDQYYLAASKKGNKQGQALNSQKYSQNKINEQQENEAMMQFGSTAGGA